MAKYNLLIIDDDIENRRSGYEGVLGDEYFDLEYINSGKGSELEKIKNAKAHGFILDMNLSKWSGDPGQDLFRRITELIGSKGPVFLISNMWNQDMIHWVNESKSIINIVHYISWDNDIKLIFDKQNTISYIPIRENIKTELDSYFEKESLVLRDDETIRILHISDLQFGDKDLSQDSIFLEDLIPKYLSQAKIPIHLIVVSGDISFSGIPSEFKKAELWCIDLCKEILGADYKSRLIFVPGNHDVNLRLNAADKYKYDFKSKKLIEIEVPSTNEHHFYGLTPFREFAYRMTDNPIWMTNSNHLCFANDRFLNWGLRFYNLNSVIQQYYDEPNRAGIPPQNLKQLLAAPKISDNTFKIVISHHGPENFGYKQFGESDERWINLRNFLEATTPQLFLHGHVHGFDTYKTNEKGTSNMAICYHMTSTLSLDKQLRMKEALRGFSVIELPRENGVIQKDSYKIRNFEIVGEKIREQRND